MKRVGQRKFLFALPCAMVTVMLLTAMAWERNSICADPSGWSDSGGRKSLITLADLSPCSLLERKAVYRHLSPAQRMTLWSEHWTSFLGPQTTLTSQQQATVRLAVSHAGRYFSSTPTANRAAIEADGLTSKRLKVQFGDSLAIAVFAILGRERGFTGHNLADLLRSTPPQRGGPFFASELPPYCTCAIQSDWCCQGTCSNDVDCIMVPSACETIWGYDCDGLCGT